MILLLVGRCGGVSSNFGGVSSSDHEFSQSLPLTSFALSTPPRSPTFFPLWLLILLLILFFNLLWFFCLVSTLFFEKAAQYLLNWMPPDSLGKSSKCYAFLSHFQPSERNHLCSRQLFVNHTSHLFPIFI